MTRADTDEDIAARVAAMLAEVNARLRGGLTDADRARGSETIRQRRRDRIEDYEWIGGPSMRPEHAAARLGLHVRTIQSYRRELRQGGQP